MSRSGAIQRIAVRVGVIMTVSYRLCGGAGARRRVSRSSASPAHAQGGGKWEFEAHGGFASATFADRAGACGNAAGAAAPVATPFPCRHATAYPRASGVSSWFFGDGRVAAEFGEHDARARVEESPAIDPVFLGSAASHGNGAKLRVPQCTAVSVPAIFAEGTLDFANTARDIHARRARRHRSHPAARSSRAFRGLFISGPSLNPT
jgi:hypothetical protein